MSFLQLKEFNRGLDARNFMLAQPAGTLLQLNNAHVTPGGEIEKRKKFLKVTLPAGTFGGQEAPAGIYVFGSGTDPGVTSPFIYLRCQHPAVLAGETYAAGSHAMAAVITSCLFGNTPFAVCKFADNTVWAYYNGALISDFTAGLVLAYMNTNAKIATTIKNLLTSTASYANSVISVADDKIVDIIGPEGVSYALSTQNTSAAGTLSAALTDAGLPAVPGVQASAQFSIIAALNPAGSVAISQIGVYQSDGTTLVANLLSASVPYNTSINQTASDVVTAINAYTGTSGFFAQANATLITIYKIATGTATNTYILKITTNLNTASYGALCIGKCAIGFSGSTGTGANTGIATMTANGVDLIGGTVVGNASLTTFLQTLCTTINGRSATTGYVACLLGSTVFIAKQITRSDDAAITIAISAGSASTSLVYGDVTPTGAVITLDNATNTTNSSIDHYVTTSGGSVPFYNWQLNGGTYNWASTNPSVVNIAGAANPPYTFNWLITNLVAYLVRTSDGVTLSTSQLSTSLLYAVNPLSQSTGFILSNIANNKITDTKGAPYNTQYVIGTVVCTVTDANNNITQLTLNVRYTLY